MIGMCMMAGIGVAINPVLQKLIDIFPMFRSLQFVCYQQ